MAAYIDLSCHLWGTIPWFPRLAFGGRPPFRYGSLRAAIIANPIASVASETVSKLFGTVGTQLLQPTHFPD